MIDDLSVGNNGAVTITPSCLAWSHCVHFLRMEVYIIGVLLSLAGVTSVKLRQTIEILWTPDCVTRKAA